MYPRFKHFSLRVMPLQKINRHIAAFFAFALVAVTVAVAQNPAPTINSISPQSGSTAGGTAVTLNGTNFLSGATVTIGGAPASGVTVVNSSSITATTPANTAGTVNVTVTNPDGQSATLAGTSSPLANAGFESGAVNWVLAGSGGAASILSNSANAHSGTGYAELSAPAANGHPVVYAATSSNVPMYFAVNPGDILNFGGWAYHVSGDGKARWGIEVSDANKSHAVYVSASPYNITTSSWVNFQSSYTVPTGMAFVRVYCEVVGSTGPAVDRFDDALFQRTVPGGGFTYQAPAAPPVISSLSTTQGGSIGGDTVTITGTGFVTGATVTFGGTPAAATVVSSTLINVTTPAVTPGSVDVTVTNPNGMSSTRSSVLHNESFESGLSYLGRFRRNYHSRHNHSKRPRWF